MNIREATLIAIQENKLLRKKDRTENWCLYVAAGTVFRNFYTDMEVELDARDILGLDWYVVKD